MATPSTSNSNSICGEVLFKMGFKFIFLVFFEELLRVAMWLNCPRAEGQGAKKEVCFAHRILVFHSLSIFSFFCMMSSSM
jgi:hypothetical protein